MDAGKVAASMARTLLESARWHKRAAKLHRTAARKAMQDLDGLRKQCEANGIKLEVA